MQREGLDEEEETMKTDWLGLLWEACPLTAAQFALVAESAYVWSGEEY